MLHLLLLVGPRNIELTTSETERDTCKRAIGDVLQPGTRDLVTSGASNIRFRAGCEVELKGLDGQHRLYALAPN